MKKYKKTTILILSCTVSLMIYFQVINPISFETIDISCATATKFEYKGLLYDYKKSERWTSSDPTEQYFNDSKELPSKNPNDYTLVVYNIRAKNHSVFDIPCVETIVNDIGKEKSRFLYKYPDLLEKSVDRFKTATVYCKVAIYTKGLSQEKIRNLVNQVTIKVIYNTNNFGTKTKLINFKNNTKYSKRAVLDLD